MTAVYGDGYYREREWGDIFSRYDAPALPDPPPVKYPLYVIGNPLRIIPFVRESETCVRARAHSNGHDNNRRIQTRFVLFVIIIANAERDIFIFTVYEKTSKSVSAVKTKPSSPPHHCIPFRFVGRLALRLS